MMKPFRAGEIVEFWETWGGMSQKFRGKVEEVSRHRIMISTNFGKTFDVDPRMVQRYVR